MQAIDWPDSLPPFADSFSGRRGFPAPLTPTLFASPDGRLVIRKNQSADFPEPRYDLVDREGRWTGVLVIQPNEAVIGFGFRHIYVISLDNLDLQWLRRHPWP
jgi:hypothetical protein